MYFSKRRDVAVASAVGCVCAETIVTYPPGIPTLLPGEVVTQAAADQVRAMGLEMIKVVSFD